jgi:hypothetical protein
MARKVSGLTDPTVPATSKLILPAANYPDPSRSIKFGDVRMYPRALTAAEVVALAAARPSSLT